jgi:hypothetical protein
MDSIEIPTKFWAPRFVGIIGWCRCGIRVVLIVTELTEETFDAGFLVLLDQRFGARFVHLFISLSELTQKIFLVNRLESTTKHTQFLQHNQEPLAVSLRTSAS